RPADQREAAPPRRPDDPGRRRRGGGSGRGTAAPDGRRGEAGDRHGLDRRIAGRRARAAACRRRRVAARAVRWEAGRAFLPDPGEGRIRAIGLMSGTSADGIDAALISIGASRDRPEVSLDAFLTLPYPGAVRDALREAFADRLTTRGVCLLNACLGELFAEAAVEVARAAGLALADVDFSA